MQNYKDLVQDILDNGIDSDDRTGTGTLSLFGKSLEYDLQEGFPLVTLKKTWWKGILVELLWILRGETNVKSMTDHNVNIWNEWADKDGDLGPVYGAQLRNWEATAPGGMHAEHIDQLRIAIDMIKNDPNSRRIIYSLWNVGQLKQMALMPCHGLTVQFYVREGKLSAAIYQRSADVFLGLPFDLASYAALIHMLAKECDLNVGTMTYFLGDCHIYKNLIDQTKEMLARDPMPLPQLTLNYDESMLEFINKAKTMTSAEILEAVKVENYNSHGLIKGKVSV